MSEINPEVGKHYLTSMGTATITSCTDEGDQGRWYGHTGEGTSLWWSEFGEAYGASKFTEGPVRLVEFDLKEEVVCVYSAKWTEPGMGEFDETHITPFFTTEEMARAAAWSDIQKYQARNSIQHNVDVTVEAIRVYSTLEQAQATRVGDLLEYVKGKLTPDEWALLKTRLQTS